MKDDQLGAPYRPFVSRSFKNDRETLGREYAILLDDRSDIPLAGLNYTIEPNGSSYIGGVWSNSTKIKNAYVRQSASQLNIACVIAYHFYSLIEAKRVRRFDVDIRVTGSRVNIKAASAFIKLGFEPTEVVRVSLTDAGSDAILERFLYVSAYLNEEEERGRFANLLRFSAPAEVVLEKSIDFLKEFWWEEERSAIIVGDL